MTAQTQHNQRSQGVQLEPTPQPETNAHSDVPVSPNSGRRIAVVGSGISGLIAAWILSKTDTVTLFEKDDRLGGHAHTHTVVTSQNTEALNSQEPGTIPVDSGFIVFNERTYPTLIRLFHDLGVASQPSDMSMSVTCHGCGLSYAGGKGLRGIFPSTGTTSSATHNLFRPRYLKMLVEVRRFHRFAQRILDADPTVVGATGFTTADVSHQTLADFLAEHRFSTYFTTHFLTPLISAVWSCNAATAAQYPARYLFTFLAHHGMLSVSGSPQWLTVRGGSAEYVRRAAASIADIRLGTPVHTIKDDGVKVTITTIPTVVAATVGDSQGYAEAANSKLAGATMSHKSTATLAQQMTDFGGISSQKLTEEFDAVVIATHPQQAAALLEADHPARRVLEDLPYSTNVTVLHRDESVLPASPDTSASWNYLLPDCEATPEEVLVSYDLSRLQSLGRPGGKPIVVSLGLEGSIAEDQVIERMIYEHPQYTPDSLHAQEQLPQISSPRIAFAGAYHGWGFHEDGALSGLRAAEHLGGSWPE